ncbi:MAG: response regulator [Pararhodobacter sp.]|nr:response regulator [Pararhodobacter sp.]
MTSEYEVEGSAPVFVGGRPTGTSEKRIKSILLVDDDPLMLKLLRTSLDKAGWAVFASESVGNARRILHAHPEITVVVSDIHMPSETGFDLVNWLNETCRDDRHTEAILITGDSNDEALIAALRCRVFDFLQKPCDLRNLITAADRAYRTAYARRDRFRRLSMLGSALDQVRQEQLHFQTQLREAEARFEDTRARLTYVGQTMAGVVSHELRTPLIPIIGLAEVLETSHDLSPDEIREFAGEIRRAGESLASIVDNALSFIDIDRQVRTQPHESIDLAELIQELIADLAPQAGEKAVTITLACAPKQKVRGPHFLLRGAVRAVMDNAVKASPHAGAVAVSVRLGDRAVVDIGDNGPGLSKHVRKNFGAPFMNGDNSDTRTWPGIGLGIASALRVIEACGGTLAVLTSEPGSGTVIRITLPAIGNE